MFEFDVGSAKIELVRFRHDCLSLKMNENASRNEGLENDHIIGNFPEERSFRDG